MKRSGFRKKSFSEYKPMKRTPLRKVSVNKKSVKVKAPKLPATKLLEKKVWLLCKQLIRRDVEHTCYTCGSSNLSGVNLQTGHGKPKGALPMKYKYDLRNLKNQCMRCNVHLGGQSDIFISKLEREKDGLQFLKDSCVKIDGRWEIKHDQTMGTIESKIFLMELIDKYTEMLSNK